MKTLRYISLIVLIILSCSNNKKSSKDLEDSVQTIELMWIGWACDCPHWIEPKIYEINQGLVPECDQGDICYEIEPAHDSLEIPNEYWGNPRSWTHFIFTGRFYKEKQTFKGNDGSIKAKTFRYTDYKYVTPPWDIANSRFRIKDTVAEFKIDSLSLAMGYKDTIYEDAIYYSTIVKYPDSISSDYQIYIEFSIADSLDRKEKIFKVDANNGIIDEINNE